MASKRPISFNLGLPDAPLTQDMELFFELVKVYNAIKACAYALDDYTGALTPATSDWPQLSTEIKVNGTCKVYYPAYEALVFANTVAFYNDAGATKVRKADGSTYKCRGFCSAPNGVAAGAYAEITLLGQFPQFASGTLTPGATYYQSTTPGVVGSSGPQAIGYAITDKILFFNPAL